MLRHWRPFEGRLSRRGWQQYLTHVPFSYASLVAGHDDVAHAFFPTDALAAVRWSRRNDRPAIFSYMGLPDRPVLADRREKLRILEEVLHGSTVVVLSRAAAEGMERWFGIEPRVIYPGVDLNCLLARAVREGARADDLLRRGTRRRAQAGGAARRRLSIGAR